MAANVQASAVLTADARRLVEESKKLRARARAVRNYFRDVYHDAHPGTSELKEVGELLVEFGLALRDAELHSASGALDEDDHELAEAGDAMLGKVDQMLDEMTALIDEWSAYEPPRHRLGAIEQACGTALEMSPRRRKRRRWRAW